MVEFISMVGDRWVYIIRNTHGWIHKMIKKPKAAYNSVHSIQTE